MPVATAIIFLTSGEIADANGGGVKAKTMPYSLTHLVELIAQVVALLTLTSHRAVAYTDFYVVRYDDPACVNGYGTDGIVIDSYLTAEQRAATQLWYPAVLDSDGHICVRGFTDFATEVPTIHAAGIDVLPHEFLHVLMYTQHRHEACVDDILGFAWQWVGHGGPCDVLKPL